MEKLSSLVRELRERIAASTSSNGGTEDNEPLEIRFRSVLPNLLHAYVLPSANEREVIAVLKLLSHTARNFPGVFYHGKANAVLPVIGRILPFFAEPAFISRHEVILETVGSLLSLLRTGDREAFRQFFLDGMLLVEDLLYVASISCGTSSGKASAKVSLKCFSESFNGIIYSPHLFSDLPECCRPKDGPGILIDITDKPRWQLFATWTIKIMSKCLTEGTLYVEGLINASFVSSACALLCYGDATLHMACFDFARISTAVIDAEIVPRENLIWTILCILGQNEKEHQSFRNAVYDSSMGACLAPLHSSCSDDVVELTATDLISVFSQSLLSTDSLELKVAMCNAYIRVAKTCPPRIWHPELLFTLLSSSPCYPLIGCIQVTIDMLGPNLVGQRVMDYCIDGLSKSSTKIIESLKLGEKRMAQNLDSLKSKRQKIGEEVFISTADPRKKSEFPCLYTFEKDKDYVDYIGGSLLSFVGLLKPGIAEANHLKPETALTALSMLSLAFCNYPPTDLSLCIFQQMHAWMPLICKQAEKSSSITFDISNYLKAFHSILHLQSSLPLDRRFLQIKRNDASSVSMMLKIPWTHSLVAIPAVSLCMTKCLSVQSLSKVSVGLTIENILEVLDLALHDEVEEVRVEAVSSMPLIVLFSGLGALTRLLKRVE